ncbi:MAG: FadR family transcriptional regulator [Desulfobacterales bacterium]|nr:FadR family transcriptional regulator [Desulfobacterales bacterium]
MKKERVKRISVSEEIFNILHKKIISGEFKSGDKLSSQDKLADQYSVSRNTIREAINRLMVMGLVSSKQGIGTVVEPISAGCYMSSLSSHLSLHPITVRDFTEARVAVEQITVRLAAIRATPVERERLQEIMNQMGTHYRDRDIDAFSEWSSRFHIELARMSGNSVLLKFLETIWDFLRNFISEMSVIPDSMEKNMKYHNDICQAVIVGDGNGAQEAMRRHLNNIIERVNKNSNSEIVATSLFKDR